MALLSSRAAQAQTAGDDSVLVHHGHLKVQTWSMHGAAPLVLILTEASASAAGTERRYRATFTELLTRYVEMLGFSYYIFRDTVASDSVPGTPERSMTHLEAGARAVISALAHKGLPPAAYVGLAEGAVVAARLASQGPRPRALAVLSPSLPGEGSKGPTRWDDVIRALTPGLPLLLAMQSSCDGPMPDALIDAGSRSQRLLLLPDHDGWLAPLRSSSCPAERQVQERVPSLNVAQMVAEWLGSTVPFPE